MSEICVPATSLTADEIRTSDVYAQRCAQKMNASPTEAEHVRLCFCSGWEWHQMGAQDGETAAIRYAGWRHAFVDDYCNAKRDFLAGFNARAEWEDGGRPFPLPIVPYVFPRLK